MDASALAVHQHNSFAAI